MRPRSPGPPPTQGPLVVHDRHTGERLELTRFRVDGEVALEIRGSLPPHSQGPPLHAHSEEDEEGSVLKGTLTAMVDGRKVEVAAGETAHFARGQWHRWWNEGEDSLEFVGIARPVVDLDRYLQAVFEVVNAGPPGRPPLFYMAHVLHRHRRTQRVAAMPRPVQALLLGAVVVLGRVLGRYRGTDWPGCPERCVGAPLRELEGGR